MATWWHVIFCSVVTAVRLATRRSFLRRCGMDAGAAVWRVVLYPGVGCKVRAAALQWYKVLRLFLNLVVLCSEAGDELVGSLSDLETTPALQIYSRLVQERAVGQWWQRPRFFVLRLCLS